MKTLHEISREEMNKRVPDDSSRHVTKKEKKRFKERKRPFIEEIITKT